MQKKRMISKKKVTRFLIILIGIVLLIVGIVFCLKKLKHKEPKKIIKIVDSIEKYGYTLDDNETEYYKSLYRQLKTVLNDEPIDEEKYVGLIAKMFLADFYDLNSKITKNDIGGTQFVYESFRNDFELFAKDTVYHYLESNIYNNREQKLPIVDLVEVDNIKQESYEYGDQVDENAYVVNLKITYKEDLGYQNDVVIHLIHNNDKLEIAEMK